MLPEISRATAWAILGIVLVIAELFSASFVLVFFGVAALCVAAFSWLGGGGLTLEIFVFAVLSLAGLLLFRKKLMGRFDAGAHTVMDEKEKIVLSADVPAGGSAQVMYQGAPWTALNRSEAPFKAGESAVIERIEGVKIILSRP